MHFIANSARASTLNVPTLQQWDDHQHSYKRTQMREYAKNNNFRNFTISSDLVFGSEASLTVPNHHNYQ